MRTLRTDILATLTVFAMFIPVPTFAQSLTYVCTGEYTGRNFRIEIDSPGVVGSSMRATAVRFSVDGALTAQFKAHEIGDAEHELNPKSFGLTGRNATGYLALAITPRPDPSVRYDEGTVAYDITAPTGEYVSEGEDYVMACE